MKQYADGKALIEQIQSCYQRFIAEFDDVANEVSDLRVEGVDKTPREMLSYQLGWITSLLNWESEEQAGRVAAVPSADFKWNQLGALYQLFYLQYGSLTLNEQKECLNQQVSALTDWLETLSDDVLFEPGKRNWATTKAMWPVYKWVHINSVAPFTNFRAKIRKWKKVALK
ncbi:Uncharacterized conserved protein [Leminorella richardii]|uniref:Uncharacterized conserved protein n=1 Tax=Leminorella richardii TaxID=158841 RepID=A0A2X4V7L5_9GAMM|nr:ClbS/DfsB family four-helix bundle protein [Leminorella richardii]SQI44168.1 Uncharacterized conserved protein [Leminorella richardii]